MQQCNPVNSERQRQECLGVGSATFKSWRAPGIRTNVNIKLQSLNNQHICMSLSISNGLCNRFWPVSGWLIGQERFAGRQTYCCPTQLVWWTHEAGVKRSMGEQWWQHLLRKSQSNSDITRACTHERSSILALVTKYMYHKTLLLPRALILYYYCGRQLIALKYRPWMESRISTVAQQMYDPTYMVSFASSA